MTPMPKIIGFLALAAFIGNPLIVRAESIERELYRRAPDMIKTLKDKGYKNVGVLRFLVKKGDEKPTTLAGTLNLDMANRVAIALILQNNAEPPLGILRDANAGAAKIPGASHLTKEGREKLFAARYPLAWGSAQVAPDAFVTGIVKISKDLAKMTVDFTIVNKDKGLIENAFKSIEGTTEPCNLAEAGESFHLRGLFDKGQLAKADPVVAAQEASKVKEKLVSFPLDTLAAPPVTLDILYDNEKVPLNIEAGTARVKEPKEGQKVAFVLSRNANVKGRYKMVLKVNGLNTVGKERFPDLRCRGWVLENNTDSIKIEGFQMDDNSAEQFTALSRAVSRDKEVYYGDNVGTITLTVFAENLSKETPPVEAVNKSLEKENVLAVQFGAFPTGEAKTLDSLQTKLRGTVSVSRGLIEGGNHIPFQVNTVNFVPEPTPIMSVVISYYRPQAR